MELVHIKENLFTNKTAAYAHCISLDCAMGAGIAKQFVKYYLTMQSDLKKTIQANHLSYPITLSWHSDEEERYIFNLVTKNKYWNKPTYDTITICLEQLSYQCKTYNIKELAMPLIGCGLDKLEWCKVETIIKHLFECQDITVYVYSL